MSSPVIRQPSYFGLSSVQVGRPVSCGHVLRVGQETAYLGGYVLHQAGAFCGQAVGTGRTAVGTDAAVTVPVQYRRHPSCKVVALTLECRPVSDLQPPDTVTVGVTLPAGAQWYQQGDWDGAAVIDTWRTGQYSPCRAQVTRFVDVSGVTAGSLDAFLVTVTSATTGAAAVIPWRVILTEVPLLDLDPVGASATERCMDQAWGVPPQYLIDGGGTSPRGFPRMVWLMDELRAGFAKHWQLINWESANTDVEADTYLWCREDASFGTPEWCREAAFTPTFYFRPRNLYGTAVNHDFRVRYKTSSAAIDADIKIKHRGYGSALAHTEVTLPLPASTSWTWAGPSTVALPVDGTAGIVEIQIEARSNDANERVYFSNIGLTEASV